MLCRLVAALVFLFLNAGLVRGQAPVAYNDTVTVVQFSTDTINVAAIDSSTGGDSLCLFKIYGSHNFALVNCSDVVYHPDTTFTGWDTQTLDISRLAAGMYFVNNMKLVKE